MDLKNYLLDTFNFNDFANKKLLEKIRLLEHKEECIKLFSHLINCQFKWMARISKDPKAQEMSWWDPIYDFEKLEQEWTKSLDAWTKYILTNSDVLLSSEVTFTGFDKGLWAATPKDIALQLNYHSIHHWAQIQTLIRKQGVEPDFVDYIGTYRKLS